jgi:hypothetical protein
LSRLYWSGYRERLERPQPHEAIEYSLWVDWFEDGQTAPEAFGEVLGHDVERPTRLRRTLCGTIVTTYGFW